LPGGRKKAWRTWRTWRIGLKLTHIEASKFSKVLHNIFFTWRTWRVSTSSVLESSKLKFSKLSRAWRTILDCSPYAKSSCSNTFRLVLQVLQVLHAKNMFPAQKK
jgi:hypothetical protein